MLPDFPELKTELSDIVLARLRGKMRVRSPLLASLKHFTQHEGRVQRYEQRPEGNMVEDGFEVMSAEVVTPVAEVPTLVGPKLEAKLDELAEKAVAQMERSLFKKIEEATAKAGTTVDAKGRAMSPELILEMMGKVQMEFDSAGNPTNTFVVHPDMTPIIKATAEEIENDPELKRRHEELLRKQREAWAAREDNRKLAD